MPEQPCPHVSPAMIAAGFTRCALCESNPRAAKEDTSVQEARVIETVGELETALNTLATEATKAARACRRKKPAPDMDRVRAAWRDVDVAEQRVDIAVYDLSTARGADG